MGNTYGAPVTEMAEAINNVAEQNTNSDQIYNSWIPNDDDYYDAVWERNIRRSCRG